MTKATEIARPFLSFRVSLPAPAVAVAIVAIAFVLRVYRLSELPPGLNGDVAWNLLDILDMRETGKIPLYFPSNFGREPLFIYLQAVMAAALGATPFAAKLTAAFVGTCTVALLYRLARALFGQDSWAPLVSAFALNFTLYHIVQSRLGFRAISLAPLAIASFYFFWEGYQGGRWHSFLLAGLFLGLGFQTYLAARLLPVALIVLLAVAVLGRWPFPADAWRKGLAATIVAAVAAAPLFQVALQNPGLFLRRTETVVASPETALDNLSAIAGMFLLRGDGNINHNLSGRPMYDAALGLLFTVGVAVALTATVSPVRRRLRFPAAWEAPAVLMLAWFGVMLVPSLLSTGAPHFLRSTGAAAPAALLIGLAADALRHRLPLAWRRVGFSTVGLLLLFGAISTTKDYFGRWAQHEDLQRAFGVPVFALAEYLRPRLMDHPVGLYAPAHENGTFQYVLRHILRDEPPPLLLDLKHVFVQRQGVSVYPPDMEFVFFEFEWGPSTGTEGQLPPWLRNGLTIAIPDSIALSFSLPASVEALPDAAFGAISQANTSFGGMLALSQRWLPEKVVLPGQPFGIVLRWESFGAPPKDYHVSLRAFDAQRRPWSFMDERLGDGFPAFATSDWRPGDTVYTAHWLTLPHDTPPGRYSVAITVFGLHPLQNLAIETPAGPRGDLLEIGEVEVAAPSPLARGAMRPAAALDQRWTGLRLFGYSVDPPAAQAGEPFDLHLFWETKDATDAAAVRLSVEDASGAVVTSVVEPPLSGAYPFSRWSAGDAFHDVHRILLPPRAAAGGSRLTVTLLSADGTSLGEPLVVSGPEIRTRARQFEAPAGLKPLGAAVGDLASLLGYTAPDQLRAGSWPVTLAWRAVGETERSYAVTLQLLDANGRLIAQNDGPPANGAAPASSWLSGEVVQDQRVLTLPVLAPGTYTLIAALYDPSTGERLPVRQGDRSDDHVVVASYPVP